MNLGRVHQWTGLDSPLLSSCFNQGQSSSTIVSIFLAISLYFTIFFFYRLKSHLLWQSFCFISGVARTFGALKLIDKNKGTSSPSRWWPWLSFLVRLVRWKWFDMETRLTCSIFAMLSGSLTRTLGSCFDEGIGRFHFSSVALISQTQQNSEIMTSKSQLLSVTNITSSLKPSEILNS